MNKIVLVLALVALILNSCGRDKDYVVTISTSYGDMKVLLYDETPKHKENFLKLAREGQYDSTIFHRVISQFMVQGGDIARKPNYSGDRNAKIPAEFVKKYFHKRGALAAARQPDQYNPERASSISQFYIVQGKVWTEDEMNNFKVDQQKLVKEVGRLFRMPGYDSISQVMDSLYQNRDYNTYTRVMLSLIPDIKEKLGIDVTKYISPTRLKTYTTLGGYPPLDDEYTVFGEVVEGMEVVDKIAAVETKPVDQPISDIFMKVTVEEMPKTKITKLYGFEYPEEKTMKILITGANGLLGNKIVEQLVAKRANFLATSQGRSRFSPDWHVPYKSMDITSKAEVNEVIGKFIPDVVIHTAAMTNVDECELNKERCDELNIMGTQNIVDACTETKSFLIHLSTDFIFSGKKGPLTENEEPDPVNYYGISKLKSEEIVQKSKLSWAIARTVLVYGVTSDMSRSNIILWVKKSLEEGKEIQVVNDQFRTPTLAEDLATGCLLIAESKNKGIFNISGKDFLTPYDMALKTAKYFNLDASLIRQTDSSIFKQPAARPLRTGFIINKAMEKLKYNPHSFESGIKIVASQIEGDL